MVLLHGIESHAGWFAGTCQWLSRLGFHVMALQRRGSGVDQRQRGDIDSYATWISDVAFFASSLRQQKPEVPIHLLGISWGGKLACACAVSSSQPWMTSLVLVSPGLVRRVDVSLLTKMRIAIDFLLFPGRLYDVPIAGTGMFTKNEAWEDFIAQDALRLKRVTARFLVQNKRLDNFLRKRLKDIKVPVLALFAETDEIIDNERTKAMISRFDSSNKRILEYPGATHTLEFEDNPDIWRKDLLAWLDSFKPL